ncbi:isoamylase early set domain-containing protein [Cellulosilyticum sp. I15G10I2]|uniref:isoamylase early set domain-containing protein n=1 Tax=Cellulosilyticum sp. I15G10I2 TaxID=1892843 RepID=UPI00085CDF3A|nr:isoamylase early set domain-containing protein [Cellulosilyticum sp. I15G10I2]
MQQNKKDHSIIIGLSISLAIIVFGVMFFIVLGILGYTSQSVDRSEVVIKNTKIMPHTITPEVKQKPYFTYEEQQGFKIYSVSVIGAFNNWNKSATLCQRDDAGVWFVTVDLEPGEYEYRFFINNELVLNDPWADKYMLDQNNEVVSVVIINDDGQRANTTGVQYDLSIRQYATHSFEQEDRIFENYKIFNIYKDKQVVHSIDCTDISGLSAIVAVWYRPDGRLYGYTGEVLSASSKDEGYFLYYSFPIDEGTMLGKWKVHIFANGYFLIEDSFTITDGNSIEIQDIVQEGEEIL